jgi:hypothetical protein
MKKFLLVMSIASAIVIVTMLPLPVTAQAPAAKGKQAKQAALPPPGGSITGAEGNPLSNTRTGPSGPVPHMPDGKPDFSGVWYSPRTVDPGKPEMLPWAAKLTQERTESHSKDDPESRCLPAGVPRMNPFPWKILQTSSVLAMLFEGNIHTYRQVFLDGRGHPKNLDPTWYGHSIGTWEGDTLVIDSTGFNDKFWFDFAGHPHTTQLRVTERFRRRDFGNMDQDITILDPGAYTKPWISKRTVALYVNGEVEEYICNEDNQDVEHLVGK